MSVEGNFEDDLTDDGAVITKYNGSDISVIIPDTLGGCKKIKAEYKGGIYFYKRINDLYAAVNGS